MEPQLGAGSAARRDGGSIVMLILFFWVTIGVLAAAAMLYQSPQDEWRQQMEGYAPPQGAVLVSQATTSVKISPFEGETETETWIYFAILQVGDETEAELQAHYAPLLSQSDETFSGSPSQLLVLPLTQDTVFDITYLDMFIHELGPAVRQAKEQYPQSGGLYLVLIYKPGRSYLYN